MQRMLVAMSLVTMLGAGLHGQHVHPVRHPATIAHAPAPRPVHLNTATSRELRSLPGVGELLAQRIIAARPFSRVAALRTLKGLPATTYDRLAPLVTL